LISSNETKPAPSPAPAPATNQAAAAAITIKLAPLPTLVPEITPQARTVTANRPRAAAGAAAAPQPAAPTTLVLRDVSAPQVNRGGGSSGPAPVVNTQSSR
jgi:hypothetical protein